MLSRAQIIDAVHAPGLGRADRLLLCFGLNLDNPWTVAGLREVASEVGLRDARIWNVSAILGRQNGLVVRGPRGWELTSHGRARINELARSQGDPQVFEVLSGLRDQAQRISNPVTLGFVEEALACLEHELLRAAVVLSWAGAISVLYEHVLKHHLGKFNCEGKRRIQKWRDIVNIEGLSRIKEGEFLDIAEGAAIIGRSIRDELQGCLRLRNGCAHPNKLRIGKARAAAHVESLINNVYSAY